MLFVSRGRMDGNYLLPNRFLYRQPMLINKFISCWVEMIDRLKFHFCFHVSFTGYPNIILLSLIVIIPDYTFHSSQEVNFGGRNGKSL